jgi:hypothetical protein
MLSTNDSQQYPEECIQVISLNLKLPIYFKPEVLAVPPTSTLPEEPEDASVKQPADVNHISRMILSLSESSQESLQKYIETLLLEQSNVIPELITQPEAQTLLEEAVSENKQIKIRWLDLFSDGLALTANLLGSALSWGKIANYSWE